MTTTTKPTAKRGFLRPYKSYMFRKKDPVIDVVRTAVEDSNKRLSAVTRESGVSYSTIYNWFNGKTRRPQFATVNAVARVVGHEFKLTPVKAEQVISPRRRLRQLLREETPLHQ